MPEKPRCPLCGHVMQYRKRANGFVCKNWKCKIYWKYGRSIDEELFAKIRERIVSRR